MSRRPGVTDAELVAAKGVIQRYYHEWIESTAADLIKQVYQGQWTQDADMLQEAIRETADSAMTYFSDQYLTIFATNSHDEALDRMRDIGNELPDNFPAPWAYYAFEADLNDIIQGADVLEPYRDGQSSEEQIAWLLENHGKCFYRKTSNNRLTEAWFIGVVGEDTREEVDFGVLIVNDNDDDQWLSVARLINVAGGSPSPELREMALAWDAFETLGNRPDPRWVDGPDDVPNEED